MEFIFGIEIEWCISQTSNLYRKLANNYRSLTYAQRTSIPDSKFWKACSDASVYSINDRSFRPVELNTVCLRSFDELYKAFCELGKLFDFSLDDEKAFKDNIEINKSCGGHLHISVITDTMLNILKKNGIDFSMKDVPNHLFAIATLNKAMSVIPLRYLHRARNKFLRTLTDEKERSKFKKQYFRQYAYRMRQETDFDWSICSETDRLRTEFTPTTKKGIEWRSFNFMGCKSLFHMYEYCERAFSFLLESILEGEENGYMMEENVSSSKFEYSENFQAEVYTEKLYIDEPILESDIDKLLEFVMLSNKARRVKRKNQVLIENLDI